MLEMIDQIGPLYYPLTALSIIALAIILERSYYYLKLPKLNECWILKNLQKELENNKGVQKELRDELISHRLFDYKEKLNVRINFLRIIATISPMLGLLGTILGIITSFKAISDLNAPVTPAVIADGLWSAMLTTAYGLIIALPCLFAAFIFMRIASHRLHRYQKILNEKSFKLAGVKL